jgi:hypothetical protein
MVLHNKNPWKDVERQFKEKEFTEEFLIRQMKKKIRNNEKFEQKT